MKTAAVHPALLPFLCGSLVDARPQAAAGLFEQLTAKEGDPPTFSAKECGRPAHIHPATRPQSSCDPPTFILCTRPHSSCVPAHIHPVYPQRRASRPPSFRHLSAKMLLKRCSVKTADALREADEKRGPGTT